MFAELSKQKGLTLIELIIVIVILGVLSVTAIPKFIDFGTDASVSTIKSLEAAITASSTTWYGICQIRRAECDVANQWPNSLSYGVFTVGYRLDYPEAGDNIAVNQIDTLVEHSGFTVVINSGSVETKFTLDSAPEPANCAVTYRQALLTDPTPLIANITTGC